MGRLIKMDFYRLFQSKLFWILSGIFFFLQFLLTFLTPLLLRWLISMSGAPYHESDLDTKLSAVIETPMPGLLMIIAFISATSFMYADLKNGYIKNIAGQISKKGYTTISKFTVLLFHNLFYMVLGVLAGCAGGLLSPGSSFVIDKDVPQAIEVFFIKYLLTLAMVSVILFIITALQNNVFATVMAVLFCVGALSLVYLGIDQILSLMKVKDFSITNYVPDQLYQTVSISEINQPDSYMALTAVIVGVAFIAVFVTGSVLMFNKRDVK